MKGRRICLRILLLALVPLAAIAGDTQLISVSRLKSILGKQGFTGMLNSEAHFRNLGILACGSNRYQVFYYEWYQMHRPYHAQYRILFVESSSTYVGSYVVQDCPKRVSRDSVIFGYAENDGNKIQCSADGLPDNLVLNGEGTDLFK
jgi:hypothetical protein